MHFVQSSIVLLSILFVPLGKAAFAPTPPVAHLDNATFIGTRNGSVVGFLGIPFAQPPVDNLRFRLPQPPPAYTGTHNATDFGPACIQQNLKISPPPGLPNATVEFIQQVYVALDVKLDSEDCLTINVLAPANATTGSMLPVAVWIYGGGFEAEGSSAWNGSAIIERSIQRNEPIIYVSLNYRVSALGFLAGKEVEAEGVGNLGLQDQRAALRWVQQYIGAFGGDSSKVTIFGQSAGGMSVGWHLLTNGGNAEGLFRGAYIISGAPASASDMAAGQPSYDAIVSQTGCQNASDSLNCLRGADIGAMRAAIDSSSSLFSYQSLNMPWYPKIDGSFMKESPPTLIAKGLIADVPIVVGCTDDEGTMFALSSTNVTTDAEFRQYLQTNFLPGVPDDALNNITTLYPANVSEGSPYDTGSENAVTPQFKRVASFLGDAFFQSPKRFLLRRRSGKQPMWAYKFNEAKSLPILGSAHGSDLSNLYGPGNLTDYVVNFVNHLDPNGKPGDGDVVWPQYTGSQPTLLSFVQDDKPELQQDTFREDGIAFLALVLLNVTGVDQSDSPATEQTSKGLFKQLF